MPFFLFFSWEESDPARIYQQGVRLLPLFAGNPTSEASQQFLQVTAAWRGLRSRSSGPKVQTQEKSGESLGVRVLREEQSHSQRHLEGPVNLPY